ncbi:hypothetical protein K438DRAFT_1767633 [Mycena galopus ATCC 62051]|nr:hypothetical protein K438DRAFT_1767633 [Mycena galopus ATCC 62051]
MTTCPTVSTTATALDTSTLPLKSLHNKVQRAGDMYQCLWRSLRALGLPRDDAMLQPLSRNDQWGKGGVALKVVWEEEIQWFCERALMKWANEEVEILKAEFECSRRWFMKNGDIWMKIAEAEKKMGYNNDHGWRAYAHKQVVIYVNLVCKHETLWKKLPPLVIEDEIADVKKAKKEEEEREQCNYVPDPSGRNPFWGAQIGASGYRIGVGVAYQEPERRTPTQGYSEQGSRLDPRQGCLRGTQPKSLCNPARELVW